MPSAEGPDALISVVVIDDEPDIGELFATILGYDGRFDVLATALDGEGGLAAAREHRPEAVVLDWAMPDRSGAEVIPIMRAELPGTVVLVVSAGARLATEPRARRLGAHGYLDKPQAVEVLGDTLAHLCREVVDLRRSGTVATPAHPT